ncbi:hypothetical protein VNO78_34893 [Psophocarpus tetragonolobus]|uniref:Uncharacterized protein n=1 Tax=Psophocarpus tetragonolobus TaxID=3891 RepID=A0AAN9NSH1_PSOTE
MKYECPRLSLLIITPIPKANTIGSESCAPEARPGQLRPGAHRRQKGRANRCTPEADRSTQPKVQLRAF